MCLTCKIALYSLKNHFYLLPEQRNAKDLLFWINKEIDLILDKDSYKHKYLIIIFFHYPTAEDTKFSKR